MKKRLHPACPGAIIFLHQNPGQQISEIQLSDLDAVCGGGVCFVYHGCFSRKYPVLMKIQKKRRNFMGKADIAVKNWLSDNERFANLFTGMIFGGRQDIPDHHSCILL